MAKKEPILLVVQAIETLDENLRTELSTQIENLRVDFSAEIRRLDTNLRGEIQRLDKNLRAEMREGVTTVNGRLDKVVENTGEHYRKLEARVRALEEKTGLAT